MLGGERVQGRAVVRVLTGEAQRQLVGNGDAVEVCARVEQEADGVGVSCSGEVCVQPRGVAEARGDALDRDDVLGGERQPGEGACASAWTSGAGVPTATYPYIREIGSAGREASPTL